MTAATMYPDAFGLEFPHDKALDRHRGVPTPPPALPAVRVRATEAFFASGGVLVDVGDVAILEKDVAQSLEHIGRCKIIE
mgnify:CR=1 FL=1